MAQFKADLNEIIKRVNEAKNVLILGDVNTEQNLIKSPEYIQQIHCQTTTGMNGKIIDHAYTKLTDFVANGHVLYKSFARSHHHPICINLLLKDEPVNC